MSDRTFPPGFLWGVASAGHENEGNNSNSDTWFVENVSLMVFKGAVRTSRATVSTVGARTSGWPQTSD